MKQADLFEGRALRDEGIALVASHNEEWSDLAYQLFQDFAVHVRATGNHPFTTEDWRDWCGNRLPWPSHPNEFGSFWNGLARRGEIVKTGEYTQCRYKSSHATAILLWRLPG